MPEPPEKVPQLQALATEVIGDGQQPDLFFVTDQGVVTCVSREPEVAYVAWLALSKRQPLVESALENRRYGVICSVSPEETDDGPLVVSDEYPHWKKLEWEKRLYRSLVKEKEAERQAQLPPVPADFAVQPLGPDDPAKDRVTCGTCGRSWDDAQPTTWTPAPSGRCPFEYFH